MATRTKNKVGAGKILLHLILTLLTGGLWLIVLLLWYIFKK